MGWGVQLLYCCWQPMMFELVAVPILPLFLVTRHLWISLQPLSLPEIPPLQVCSGSWARFENGATYWNAGQRAYCPGPPRGMFLQIWASCTFHGNVLSKAVAVVVVSVANLAVCAAHQHGTIAQSARTEVLVVCGQAHLHLLFVSLFWRALLSHCVLVDAPHLNVPLTAHVLLTLFFAAHVCALQRGVITSEWPGMWGQEWGIGSWFQTENYGLLTQQISISMGCALSHMSNSYIHML